MKKVLWIVGIVLRVAAAGGSGFWGVMQYQINQVSQAQASFLRARGQGDGQFPEGFPSGAPGGFQGNFPGQFTGGRGGLGGQVKSLEGNVLTLSTAENVTTVTLTDTTTVVKTVECTARSKQLTILQ